MLHQFEAGAPYSSESFGSRPALAPEFSFTCYITNFQLRKTVTNGNAVGGDFTGSQTQFTGISEGQEELRNEITLPFNEAERLWNSELFDRIRTELARDMPDDESDLEVPITTLAEARRALSKRLSFAGEDEAIVKSVLRHHAHPHIKSVCATRLASLGDRKDYAARRMREALASIAK